MKLFALLLLFGPRLHAQVVLPDYVLSEQGFSLPDAGPLELRSDPALAESPMRAPIAALDLSATELRRDVSNGELSRAELRVNAIFREGAPLSMPGLSAIAEGEDFMSAVRRDQTRLANAIADSLVESRSPAFRQPKHDPSGPLWAQYRRRDALAALVGYTDWLATKLWLGPPRASGAETTLPRPGPGMRLAIAKRHAVGLAKLDAVIADITANGRELPIVGRVRGETVRVDEDALVRWAAYHDWQTPPADEFAQYNAGKFRSVRGCAGVEAGLVDGKRQGLIILLDGTRSADLVEMALVKRMPELFMYAIGYRR